MYKVNKTTKILEKVNETSFKDIKCKEREDLQEWIVSNPSILGEELLIIQKEFAGFDSTNERLDLLALDKNANLVIIENKLDDTGKDVIWQAVKYASYCSTLTLLQIKEIFGKYINKNELAINAEEELIEFFEVENLDDLDVNKENTQRIMLVSREFRAEVLSAVSWLLKFGVGIACVKVIPYKDAEDIFLDTEQILPQKELQEYTLKLVNKAKEEQQQKKNKNNAEELRNKFWKLLLPKFKEKSSLFDGISPDKYDHWLSAGSGISGCPYGFIITDKYCGVEFGISTDKQVENKRIFEELLKHKEEIEKSFGDILTWEKLENRKMSRIIIRNNELSLFNVENWDAIIDYLVDTMYRFEKSLGKYIVEVKKGGKK